MLINQYRNLENNQIIFKFVFLENKWYRKWHEETLLNYTKTSL